MTTVPKDQNLEALETSKVEQVEFAPDGQPIESPKFKKREAKLVRKLDLYIAPVVMMLMLISYLDRGNIGFAATQGMSDDIGLKGSQLNVCSVLLTTFTSPRLTSQ